MKRKIHIILTIFLLSFLSAGCGAEKLPTDNGQANVPGKPAKVEKVNRENPQKPYLIACIVNQDDQYMKLLQLGMSDAAEELGAKVILANTYGKLDKEIELINTYIKSGIDGICIHPVSVDLSMPILEKAKVVGMKVIGAGIAIDDKYNIRYIESDQWELGKKTGAACREFIESKLGGKANIAILNYKSQFPEESQKRTSGFKSELASLPGVKIVAEQDAWLAEAAVSQARSIIASQPDLNIIWAANEGGTVGAAIAVKNAQKSGSVFVFGTDVSEQLLNMLLNEDNILQAVTGQQPYKIGQRSMEQLIKDIKGEQNDGKITEPGIPLSRNNQDEVKKVVDDFKTVLGSN